MEKTKQKTPITHEKIFKIMLWVTIIVSFVFFLKNILGKNIQAAAVIGTCIAVFGGILYGMHLKKVKDIVREFVLSISLVFLVFIISLNSGEAYSDDFPMFLAVLGMTGLYLEPKFTKVQIVLIDILFVLMYLIHPEKAESLSQYIMCLAIFTLAACLFYQAIKRGRAFIEIGKERAEQSEKLLHSIHDMGDELEKDFAQSSSEIENSTNELQRGSASIAKGTVDMTQSCEDVHEKIQISADTLASLNTEVQKFENSLGENHANMEAMQAQLQTVKSTVESANEVFRMMEMKMGEVVKITEQLNTISFNTSILSLNASIEAARAGKAGAGFDVVATEMRDLSNNSNVFSERVGEVIRELVLQVEETAGQFTESTEALRQSETTMQELNDSFQKLNNQFSSLYENIEMQNRNVNQVDTIFGDLRIKVSEMHKYSAENQNAVDSIVDAMNIYKENMDHVIEGTKRTS